MQDPKTTPPRPPPVSFREVSGRQKALVNTVIEKCDVIKVRFAKELDDSKASIESKTVENVSRVASSLRSGVGIVLKVATASARLVATHRARTEPDLDCARHVLQHLRARTRRRRLFHH